jgi:ribosomal protein L21E
MVNNMKMTKKGQAKVGKVMGEYKEGTLHSGKGGKVVKSRDQAIAIAMSEAAKKMGRYKGK